jgi:UDPglucose 6-dehydrogenase
VQNRSSGRLAFSADLPTTLRAAEVLFICVGTPPLPGGQVDLSQVESVARAIGQALEDGYKVVVNKSTVPVGSGDWVSLLIREGVEERRIERYSVLSGRPAGDLADTVIERPLPHFDVVSNPEFLREGSAIEDMLHPDRIVAGSNSERALAVMRELYRPIIEQRPAEGESGGENVRIPFIETDLASAEMIKYAANAFLATKISFINEIANICERVGANIDAVANGIGQDRRIGHLFLNAGLGWGGSCFHKDLSALTHMASDYGYTARLLTAAAEINTTQRLLIVHKLQERLKVLKGKTVGLLGLAFKPHTDDVRDAPALTIAERLVTLGVRVKGYDPVAGPNARRVIPDLVLEPTVRSLARGADALVVVTEWPEFRELDFAALREIMRTPTVVDGRNFLSGPTLTRLGFDYVAIGR